MERFVTVNGFSGSNAGQGPLDAENPEDREWGFEGADPDAGTEVAGSGLGSPQRSDQGPCLYLGPKGQRCRNPAVSGGFCLRHQPGELGGPKVAARGVSRVVAAGIGILAAMWPVIADVLRELLRWIHAH
ncbi:MAG: hypothetical protein WA197_08510 [Candidatus Acidiferrales bacterium]